MQVDDLERVGGNVLPTDEPSVGQLSMEDTCGERNLRHLMRKRVAGLDCVAMILSATCWILGDLRAVVYRACVYDRWSV